MNIERTRYGNNTWLSVSYPWGLNVAGAAMCTDGKVRTLKRISETADTFFSVPAAVTVDGKTVSGYVTIEAASGSTHPSPSDPPVVKFVAYRYGKNHDRLPDGKWSCGHRSTIVGFSTSIGDRCLICEDCDAEIEIEDTRDFYRDEDGNVTW